MSQKITCNVNNPAVGGLAAIELVKATNPIAVEWGKESTISFGSDTPKFVYNSENDILRFIGRVAGKFKLYGSNPVEQTQIDQWLAFSLTLGNDLAKSLAYLEKCLGALTYLVTNNLTIADLAVFSQLSRQMVAAKKIGIPVYVQRWYNLIGAQECVKQAQAALPAEAKKALSTAAETATNRQATGERKQEGKFVDLPNAEMGKVIVRFPPEASGYLHIGHAKAALLNQHYANAFKGKLIMRFDDTNPAKETVEFEQVILGDLELLEIKPDLFTHTSNYFDLMLEYCERMLKEGKAYVDDTEPEQMKKDREQRIESVHRNNSYEKNLKMWKEMLIGSAAGKKCCVRAKIDMGSHNGCMRDPTIYRCKDEEHPRTGRKYKVYPTYDFACPIVDAIEGVTHTLRTTEYHDRNPQFNWFIEALNLRRPEIYDYSRLNMTNTVLSKRRLTWFVDEGLVDGWDDPRFPTVRGILRRGLTVPGLREFIIAQGSSKSVVFMEWDKIWAFNKKVIDPIAPRYTALTLNKTVVVNVAGVTKAEQVQVAAHPKNPEVGQKTIWTGPRILIDYEDAEMLKEGENTTFINWGNLLIKKINRNASKKITSIDAVPNLENKDYKKTIKLTWLYEGASKDDFPPTVCVYFEHIISKAVLGKDEDFKQYVAKDTRREVPMLGDPELKKCKVGDIIQLQRRGFFRVDNAYAPPSIHTGKASPVILFEIPDGSQKSSTATSAAAKVTTASSSALSSSADDLNERITKQGNLVRDLKSQKADKAKIDAAVKTLLALKTDFKAQTGKDWTPNAAPVKKESSPVSGDLNDQITKQGNLVRDLKSKKADKSEIDAAVKTLLALKADFKTQTGKDWTPNAAPVTNAAPVKTEPSPASGDLNDQITKQGNLVRDLKSKKANKAEVDAAVKTLLALKAEFKAQTGADWLPGAIAPEVKPIAVATQAQAGDIVQKIVSQGDLVRDLKTKKADKSKIDAEVKTLLALKAGYKAQTGQEYKPGATAPVTSAPPPSTQNNASQLNGKIAAQGNAVRDLKAQKADKSKIDAEVKTLLALKTEYKTLTGNDWKPDAAANAKATSTPPTTMEQPPSNDATQLNAQIAEQGNTVRVLKEQKADKAKIDAEVKTLLDLKGKYKALTGQDWKPEGDAGKTPRSKAPKPAKEAKPKPAEKEKPADGGVKKVTRLGLEATKEENLPEWYSQVLTKAELIEYYDVSGCYILRDWSFAIWKVIQRWFTDEIDKLGVKEVYFPMFVSKAALEKEKAHIADFSPEVAWVTKSGDSDLAEPVAIRPTSETVMYPTFAKWIQSYRDLPIKINQWSNVVRWEFKHPQPFLRTREFLWQEGHTAYEKKEDADAEVLTILDLYSRIYSELLAVPTMKGRKTTKEKFAGGDYTTTVEAYISASGRAIQGGTSHHLGQNFSKMFEIIYTDPETKEKKYVYQNSWGLTTRTIGVMIMIHGDNKGLVLPPNVASIQAIIVPCGLTVNTKPEEKEELLANCKSLQATLKAAQVRVDGDYRDNYSPGWKFNHWELKGVPIRIELGPKDMKAKQLVAVRRDTGEKLTIQLSEVSTKIPALLKQIHSDMFNKAKKEFDEHIDIVHNWSDFVGGLSKKSLLLTPFCGDETCEKHIKDNSANNEADTEVGALAMGAKSLCIPFDQPKSIEANTKCINPNCTLKPSAYTLFGRSY
ncbi:bifunctional glutamate/proline--tRNA ligase isoform X2 [Contarinia nasturtii]|uniref:bifunctional glutamate/proline--tRNA ligase isoform X2 n=1 Tax=Contarinia nasturtii TaxID=265458 RepID=UPI0012D4314E|nr:bifunctional glutamate/proline--tRNA ligase isoform X2 [Contarinia nasturtii]